MDDKNPDALAQGQTLPGNATDTATSATSAPVAKTEPRLAQSAEQVPTKGRVVIYYAHINDTVVEHMAHVVKVWGGGANACVNLAVFDESGQLYARTSVSKGGPDHPGTWGWPRRAS